MRVSSLRSAAVLRHGGLREEDGRRRRVDAAGFSTGEAEARCFGVRWWTGRDMAGGGWAERRSENGKMAEPEMERIGNVAHSSPHKRQKQEKSRTVESNGSGDGKGGRRSRFPQGEGGCARHQGREKSTNVQSMPNRPASASPSARTPKRSVA